MRALLLLLFVPTLAFAQAGGPPFIPVNMMKAAATPVSNTVNAVGALIAEDSVVLRPEIDGRIDKLLFQEGQPVKKGAVLVVLDSAEPRARLAAAQADLKLAQSRYKRSEQLVAQNFISKQALDEARANLDILRARLQQEQVALDKTVIRAPFAALAGLRQVSPGAYVNKGDDIVRLDALGNLKLEVPVPETYLPLVRIGLPITLTIDALPGQSFSGKVHAIDPVVDPVSRNVRVRARIANPAGNLKPGMFARATADLGGRTSAILLPEQVIVPRPDGNYVFLAVNGKAELRKVTLGKREPGRVEIVSGVQAGDTVILDGQIKLRPGVPVVTLDQAAQMMKKMQAGKPR
ncbi:MAG TPA: efflux RND transporter periplasmic adaptor subunit [Thiobacillus sp.]|nr:efflux RND transporter periplasmic adaptor subunit [Thiobacillus sp.]